MNFEPITATIPTVSEMTGWSRSEVYRRLTAGDIRAVKSGNRTLIVVESVRQHVASLPAATFRAPASINA
jgi:excisionase family DNA binding protein